MGISRQDVAYMLFCTVSTAGHITQQPSNVCGAESGGTDW